MIDYQQLGARTFINASGTITTLGGSLMPAEVLEAMRAAAGAYVDLPDLLVKSGEYLARRIGVPAAFVSCGAASGMQLAAAGCMTGTDVERVRALPNTSGWANEFVIGSVDPHAYIHQGIEACGGTPVRVGTSAALSTEEMVGAIGSRTAAVVFFLGSQPREQLAEVASGASERGVPVIVDAAAQLPPRSNLTELINMGASLAVFSGGKGLGVHSVRGWWSARPSWSPPCAELQPRERHRPRHEGGKGRDHGAAGGGGSVSRLQRRGGCGSLGCAGSAYR